jgi:hypothetical protein
MNKQKGFSLVEGLLILVVIGIVSFGGWYVATQSGDDNVNTETSKADTEEIDHEVGEEDAKEENPIPEDWKDFEEMGYSFSYPDDWQIEDELVTGSFKVSNATIQKRFYTEAGGSREKDALLFLVTETTKSFEDLVEDTNNDDSLQGINETTIDGLEALYFSVIPKEADTVGSFVVVTIYDGREVRFVGPDSEEIGTVASTFKRL